MQTSKRQNPASIICQTGLIQRRVQFRSAGTADPIAIKLSRYELISTLNIKPVKDWIKPWNTVVTEHNPPVIPVSALWLQAVPLGYWIFRVGYWILNKVLGFRFSFRLFHVGYWIFRIGYWIFCSKFLNLIAMRLTLPDFDSSQAGSLRYSTRKIPKIP